MIWYIAFVDWLIRTAMPDVYVHVTLPLIPNLGAGNRMIDPYLHILAMPSIFNFK